MALPGAKKVKTPQSESLCPGYAPYWSPPELPAGDQTGTVNGGHVQNVLFHRGVASRDKKAPRGSNMAG